MQQHSDRLSDARPPVRQPRRPVVRPEDAQVTGDEQLIHLMAREAHGYFASEPIFADGLVRDSGREDCPSSIAAIGFCLSADISAVALGLLSRDEASSRALRVVRRLAGLPHGPQTDAAGHHGFFYHFLDDQGQRTWRCELSSIDTALLMMGLLTAAAYFDHDCADEHEIRSTANQLYERVDWPWLLRPDGRLSHGWRPEAARHARKGHDRKGFITHAWAGYDESLLLMILALGSPTHPIPPECYAAWCSTVALTSAWGQEYAHCPPLFVHQFPQAWIDFRGVRDRFGREHGLDWFENSRRATLAQIEYARANPGGFAGYSATTWGISASNGPGNVHKRQLRHDGRVMKFLPYTERGITPPTGAPDDGTLAPWATAASLPFEPERCLAGVRAHRDVALCRPDWIGFLGSYNLNYVSGTCPHGWVDEYDLGIEQGPIVMMAANHLHGTLWRLMQRSEPITRGLRRAGYRGGWLD